MSLRESLLIKACFLQEMMKAHLYCSDPILTAVGHVMAQKLCDFVGLATSLLWLRFFHVSNLLESLRCWYGWAFLSLQCKCIAFQKKMFRTKFILKSAGKLRGCARKTSAPQVCLLVILLHTKLWIQYLTEQQLSTMHAHQC